MQTLVEWLRDTYETDGIITYGEFPRSFRLVEISPNKFQMLHILGYEDPDEENREYPWAIIDCSVENICKVTISIYDSGGVSLRRIREMFLEFSQTLEPDREFLLTLEYVWHHQDFKIRQRPEKDFLSWLKPVLKDYDRSYKVSETKTPNFYELELTKKKHKQTVAMIDVRSNNFCVFKLARVEEWDEFTIKDIEMLISNHARSIEKNCLYAWLVHFQRPSD